MFNLTFLKNSNGNISALITHDLRAPTIFTLPTLAPLLLPYFPLPARVAIAAVQCKWPWLSGESGEYGRRIVLVVGPLFVLLNIASFAFDTFTLGFSPHTMKPIFAFQFIFQAFFPSSACRLNSGFPPSTQQPFSLCTIHFWQLMNIHGHERAKAWQLAIWRRQQHRMKWWQPWWQPWYHPTYHIMQAIFFGPLAADAALTNCSRPAFSSG